MAKSTKVLGQNDHLGKIIQFSTNFLHQPFLVPQFRHSVRHRRHRRRRCRRRCRRWRRRRRRQRRRRRRHRRYRCCCRTVNASERPALKFYDNVLTCKHLKNSFLKIYAFLFCAL